LTNVHAKTKITWSNYGFDTLILDPTQPGSKLWTR